MRRTVTKTLLEILDKDTYFLTADVGFGVLEPLQKKMKDNFINVGVAEQSMIGIASGLALSGKKVFTYTMCSFYLRALEQIKLDLCYQDVPVTMIGCGTQFDYEELGTTHFALEDEVIMNALYNIDVYTPKTKGELVKLLKEETKRPRYIRIGRFDKNNDFEIDKKQLKKYPKEGGKLNYFKNKYGSRKNSK